jgi:AraC family transcriptional regulator, transcriptional activator FtrA
MPIIVNIMPKTKVPRPPTPGPLVAALVYDGLCTFEYGIAVELFGLSRPELGPEWYRFVSVAAESGPLRATGGLTITADAGISRLGKADLIIVPGWKGVDAPPSPRLIRALRNAHARGARLMSICSGVFVLAATGLLDHRRVTTHWRYAAALRDRYPLLRFDPDVLYIDEGDILTSAGSAAGLDLSLHVVRADFGAEVANKVARRLVLPAHRNGGQRQYVERPVPLREGARLSDVIADMRTRLDHPFSVRELASLAAMSERTFNRRFVETTGETPAAWLIAARVERARELLEGGELSMDELARRCGFGSAATLRHHFRDKLKVSPSDYRKSFGQADGIRY